jgi:phosphinothricin acetyltransferase
MEIRIGSARDLASIVLILNHYIVNTSVTFDDEPVTVDDRREWFDRFDTTGPYRLVVADDGELRGWACSSPYRNHPAFSRTVEFSICLAPTYRGRGLGTRLYERLLAELDGEDVHVALAGIAVENEASVALHRKVGFSDVGVFDEYATKRGVYFSSRWMQRRLDG